MSEKVIHVGNSNLKEGSRIVTTNIVHLVSGEFEVPEDAQVSVRGADGQRWASQVMVATAAAAVLRAAHEEVTGCTHSILRAALEKVSEGEQLTPQIIAEHDLPSLLEGWYRIDLDSTPWAVSGQNTKKLSYLQKPGEIIEGSVDEYLHRLNQALQESRPPLKEAVLLLPRLADRICTGSNGRIVESTDAQTDPAMRKIRQPLGSNHYWIESGRGNRSVTLWEASGGFSHLTSRDLTVPTRYALQS